MHSISPGSCVKSIFMNESSTNCVHVDHLTAYVPLGLRVFLLSSCVNWMPRTSRGTQRFEGFFTLRLRQLDAADKPRHVEDWECTALVRGIQVLPSWRAQFAQTINYCIYTVCIIKFIISGVDRLKQVCEHSLTV